MGLTGSIIVYVIIWWVIFFSVFLKKLVLQYYLQNFPMTHFCFFLVHALCSILNRSVSSRHGCLKHSSTRSRYCCQEKGSLTILTFVLAETFSNRASNGVTDSSLEKMKMRKIKKEFFLVVKLMFMVLNV